MIRAVIFDLDNTLTDFVVMKDQAIRAAAHAMYDMGLPLSPEEAASRIYAIYDQEGIEYQSVFDHLLRDVYGHVPASILAAGIIAYRKSRDSTLVLYPHVKLTLMELLRRGIRLAVLSDAPRLQAWQRIHHLALQHVFEHVITFDDTGQRKPAAAPFRRALELLDLAPAEVLMVGDWPDRDMRGAGALGIPTVFARYGDTKSTERSGADHEIDDAIELLDILEEMNGAPKA